MGRSARALRFYTRSQRGNVGTGGQCARSTDFTPVRKGRWTRAGLASLLSGPRSNNNKCIKNKETDITTDPTDAKRTAEDIRTTAGRYGRKSGEWTVL